MGKKLDLSSFVGNDRETKCDMCQMFWVKLLSIELLYTFWKIIYENNPFNYEKWLGNKFFFERSDLQWISCFKERIVFNSWLNHKFSSYPILLFKKHWSFKPGAKLLKVIVCKTVVYRITWLGNIIFIFQ